MRGPGGECGVLFRSGATLYVEPEAVVALNNAEARLAATQGEEEDALLLSLSRQVAPPSFIAAASSGPPVVLL